MGGVEAADQPSVTSDHLRLTMPTTSHSLPINCHVSESARELQHRLMRTVIELCGKFSGSPWWNASGLRLMLALAAVPD